MQDLPVRVINRAGPSDQSLQMQGNLLAGSRRLPQELDQQQSEARAQQHRSLLQLLQILVLDLQDPLPQDGLAHHWAIAGDDHLR